MRNRPLSCSGRRPLEGELPSENTIHLDPEKVAYWYFRLNGFLQMESFIVHPPGKGPQRTDADLLGVRFPYRREMFFDDPDNAMQDDVGVLSLLDDAPDVAVIEVKLNQPCSLNGPWSDQDHQNVHRVLAAIGCFPVDKIDEAAEALYTSGTYLNEGSTRVRLISLGRERSPELEERFPDVVQITWENVFSFIGNRLHEFRTNKRDVSQWDHQILLLQELVTRCSYRGEFDHDAFFREAAHAMGLKL